MHLADELGLELANFEVERDETFKAAVEKKEMHREFPAIHIQPKLAANEGEQAAHRAEKIFDPGVKRLPRELKGLLPTPDQICKLLEDAQ